MRFIPATRGHQVIVDDGDFEDLSQFKWHTHEGAGTSRPVRRVVLDGHRTVEFLYHRILPKKAGFVVDHINGDPWDNRRCNLRYCTQRENSRNKQRRTGTRSAPYKGVSLQAGKYYARIGVDGKSIHCGVFIDPADAARAYDRAALIYHGEYAWLNFPQEVAA